MRKVGDARRREQRARKTKKGAVPCNCRCQHASTVVSNCGRNEEVRTRAADLQHLNEGNAEIEIRLVTADQAEAVKDTDGYNGPHVQPRCHSNNVSSIEEAAKAREDLGRDGGNCKVITR